MKKAIVFGAGGFIGSHLVKKLKQEGYWVRAVDLKYPEFSDSQADEFILADLRNLTEVENVLMVRNGCCFDEIYQLAADMGGAEYIFSGKFDADIMHNSVLINLNLLRALLKNKGITGESASKIFFSSSACIYPKQNQEDSENPNCIEGSALPANPDSEYGWEKIFSERLYQAYQRNYGFNVRIARFHNIYGPEASWKNGKEKAPAAICRKVAEVRDGEYIEVWGDGKQTRSFLYIDDCIEAMKLLMNSNFQEPINIGSEEMVTIDNLVKITAKVAKKSISIKHTNGGPTGVRGRNSNNQLIRKELRWSPTTSLEAGIKKTYFWIEEQIKNG